MDEQKRNELTKQTDKLIKELKGSNLIEDVESEPIKSELKELLEQIKTRFPDFFESSEFYEDDLSLPYIHFANFFRWLEQKPLADPLMKSAYEFFSSTYEKAKTNYIKNLLYITFLEDHVARDYERMRLAYDIFSDYVKKEFEHVFNFVDKKSEWERVKASKLKNL
jgi:hypothetical protein